MFFNNTTPAGNKAESGVFYGIVGLFAVTTATVVAVSCLVSCIALGKKAYSACAERERNDVEINPVDYDEINDQYYI